MILSAAVLISRSAGSKVGPVEFTVLLLALTAFGAFLARNGYSYWRSSRMLPDPRESRAIIQGLFPSGKPWNRSFYAAVAFDDAGGRSQTATIGVVGKAWQYLREGSTISVSYSAANPQRARIGGQTMRSIYVVSGWITMIIGTGIALFCLWLLVAGWLGWIEVSPFEARHRGNGQVLPAPRPLPMPGQQGNFQPH